MFLSPLAKTLQTAHLKRNTTVLRSFTQELTPTSALIVILAILVILVIIAGIAIVTGLDLAFKRCLRFISK